MTSSEESIVLSLRIFKFYGHATHIILLDGFGRNQHKKDAAKPSIAVRLQAGRFCCEVRCRISVTDSLSSYPKSTPGDPEYGYQR